MKLNGIRQVYKHGAANVLLGLGLGLGSVHRAAARGMFGDAPFGEFTAREPFGQPVARPWVDL